MIFSEETIQGIRDGVEQGFKNEGVILNDRDRVVVEASVKTTLNVLEKLINTKGENENA